MPWTNLLPPDTRAVGTGNPPVDMNAVLEALAASGTASFNLQNPVFGGADPGSPGSPGADCSTAFQACLTAATAAAAEMVIPPGNYTVNTGVNITGPVRVRGLGTGVRTFGTGSLTTGVTLNSSNATGLFRFPYQGYLWGGLEMSGIGISYTGAGNVFHLLNIGGAVFRDMDITLTQQGSAAFYTTGSVSCLDVLFERVHITTTAPTRTQNMVSISSSIGAGISNNTWLKCRFDNAGLDTTQHMVFYQCTGTGSAYHFADNMRECWFEHPFGGCYKSLSGSNITVDGCMAWDVQSGQSIATTVGAPSNGGTISGIATWANPSAGVLAVASTAAFPNTGTLSVATSGTAAVVTYTGLTATTFTGCAYVSGTGTVATGGAVTLTPAVGNSLYYFGAAPSNAGSQTTRVTGCGRNLNGPDGSATWDVYAEATTSNIHVEGYTTSPLNPSTTYNVFFNFNGCQDVVLINNQSPQGAAVNGNSTTVVTNPGVEQVTISNGLVLPESGGVWTAADNGLLAMNFDPGAILGAKSPATNVITLMRVNVRAQISVTNILMYVNVAGVTLTSGQNWAGLYGPTGTKIGLTADQTTPWASTGVKTMALVSGPFTITPGIYYVAFVTNFTGSGPSFGRLSDLSGVGLNAGLGTGGTWRAATNGTGTTLPASFTYSSGSSAQQTLYWVALS